MSRCVLCSLFVLTAFAGNAELRAQSVLRVPHHGRIISPLTYVDKIEEPGPASAASRQSRLRARRQQLMVQSINRANDYLSQIQQIQYATFQYRAHTSKQYYASGNQGWVRNYNQYYQQAMQRIRYLMQLRQREFQIQQSLR